VLGVLAINRNGRTKIIVATCLCLFSTLSSASIDYFGKSLAGEKIYRSDYPDRVFVVGLWATWCPHCKDELNTLEALQRAFGDKILVVALSYKESRSKIRRYLRKNRTKLEFTLATDPRSKVRASLTKKRGVPQLFVINKAGQLVFSHLGYSECAAQLLLDTINAQLSNTTLEGSCEQTPNE